MSESSASTGPRQIDRKKKLGKGLGALLGETRREEPLVRSDSGQNQNEGQAQSSATTAEPATNGLTSIPVANIEPLPGQPRTHFDEESLDSLASSIATRGVIQPIIVSPLGKG
ncbi:MAG TPA: chromosome partitioning protein ParB, partial [Erythrobacter sp.]|nr:chromosome partitioning protein ParB [Erythrobacter sp.]